jgi:hypothetical protein
MLGQFAGMFNLSDNLILGPGGIGDAQEGKSKKDILLSKTGGED